MKRILNTIFSMPVTGLLLILFAFSIGYATFIENSSGTLTAKIQVYDAVWFKVMLILVVINLTGSIIVNKMINRKKWSMFLFHVAFIIIFLGGGITRYFGTEGLIHIREGSASSEYLSQESFVGVTITDGLDTLSNLKVVKFSTKVKNRFREKYLFKEKVVLMENMQFIPSASKSIVEDPVGGPVISMVALGSQNQRLEFILGEGEEKNFNNIVISFDQPSPNTTVLIRESDRGLVLTALNGQLSAGAMGSEMTRLPLNEDFPLNQQIIYQAGHIRFALRQYYPKGRVQIAFNQEGNQSEITDAFRARITVDGLSEIVDVFGSADMPGQPAVTTINGLKIAVTYGAVLRPLPFSLYLRDFQIERYPGSNSPSSFASEVTLLDKRHNREMPFRIFMNNILKYEGYRFFQSSYDQDEKGTVLSVNYDFWGTTVTYIGYLLMASGMIFTLFNRQSRFRRLIRASSKLKAQRGALLMIPLIFGLSIPMYAQQPSTANRIDRSHVRAFGELLIQSKEGRIEPVNTVASEILRKVYRENTYQGMSPVEVFLDMNLDPQRWRRERVIKVTGPDIKNMLGTTADYVSFDEMMSGGYRLRSMVDAAYGKAPGMRSKTDKEVINIDERVNITYLVLSGEFMNIFPIPDDPDHTWIFLGSKSKKLPPENHEFAIRTLTNYYQALIDAKRTGNWDQASYYLSELKQNQLKYGAKVVPSSSNVKLEVFYINFNIFGRLAKFFLFTGILLIVVVFMNIFRPNPKLKTIIDFGFYIVLILFLTEMAGLGIRWYISGHAPWSNGYESMIFISWATCLSGLIFARRSQMTLAITTILTALILLIAGLSWMSPELTNLVPVLKSYWLIVHVAIVTASYGFLGIGALLGLTNLLLMILRNKQNTGRVTYTIRELVYITEIALIIGLYMLTIGSFIGGVWANESWGRYWGWDPKETWALVTILVYSFIVHMHRIPGFKGDFQLSTAALIGFGSVLMTYFGVNYYFSGLHSYASGEAAPVPKGVYIAVALILLLILSAFFSQGQGYRKAGKIDALMDEEV